MESGKDKAKQKNLNKEDKELKQKVAGKNQQTELKEFEYEHESTLGEKKNIQGAWPPAYNPAVIEKNWYEWWSKQGYFTPDAQLNVDENAPPFTIVIPPPNVTGSLHIGHALTNAVQDALVRYYRQRGCRTEWLSGMDHAGISCQVVVEKQLAKQGIDRHALGREKFLEKVWEWKAEYGGRISEQLRKLGSSLDWSREVFTMDAPRTKSHDEMFRRFFEAGLIYRDNRLVGWDCTLQTAVSDVEIEYLDVSTPIQLQVGAQKYPFGYLWSFTYPVVTADLAGLSDEALAQKFEQTPEAFTERLTFATTRPETMLGDSALAIHPEDARYAKYHGLKVFHPLRKCRIPIVLDAVLVDPEFGTGVVKVTPAHDANDFEVGKRHGLEFCNMLQPDGRCFCPQNPAFHGVPRLDARIKIIQLFTQLKLYEGKTPNPMAIGLSQRSRDVIEPMLKPQWYVNCTGMAARALEAVEKGELIITPKTHEATWRSYLGNIRPWCISRQLWWGHQIPLYKVWVAGQEEPDGSRSSDWVFANTDALAVENGCKKLGCSADQIKFKRDEDVTDTWFSSAMFPFSAFGWPEEGSLDFQKFFPGSVLETGYDILFFWVARMVMVSLQLFDKLPFKEVYLHAMVRDSKGEKMSKSKGNVIDPLDCIYGASLEKLGEGLKKTNLSAGEIQQAVKLQAAEFPAGIPQCGTDALRMALCVYTGQGRQINLDVNKIVAQRNFCNKIFNAVKFALEFSKLDQAFVTEQRFQGPREFLESLLAGNAKVAMANKFVLQKLSEFVHVYNKAMRQYNLSAAAESCISFFWGQLCDVYLELVKPVLVEAQASAEEIAQTKMVLFLCLDQALRLIHPFMPFLTEEMFQRIPRWPSEMKLETIMFASMPVDCKHFNIGATNEYEQYDEICVDKESIYYRIQHAESINDTEYEQMKPLINAARSLKAQYKVNQRLTFYIQTQVNLTNEQLAAFKVLSGAASVSLIRGEKPAFCGSVIIDESFVVHAELKGIIDVDKELARIEKEMTELIGQREKLATLMASENYQRLPENLRAQNVTKMAAFEEKQRVYEQLKVDYLALK